MINLTAVNTHQVSVDEAVGLQVLHPLTDVLAHGQKPRLLQGPAPLPQEVQQAAVLHELGHDQQGALLQANTVQLHQFRVAQPPGKHNNKPSFTSSSLFSHLCLSASGPLPPPYIMTLASSMKSSSYMAPSLMALMATLC